VSRTLNIVAVNRGWGRLALPEGADTALDAGESIVLLLSVGVGDLPDPDDVQIAPAGRFIDFTQVTVRPLAMRQGRLRSTTDIGTISSADFCAGRQEQACKVRSDELLEFLRRTTPHLPDTATVPGIPLTYTAPATGDAEVYVRAGVSYATNNPAPDGVRVRGVRVRTHLELSYTDPPTPVLSRMGETAPAPSGGPAPFTLNIQTASGGAREYSHFTQVVVGATAGEISQGAASCTGTPCAITYSSDQYRAALGASPGATEVGALTLTYTAPSGTGNAEIYATLTRPEDAGEVSADPRLEISYAPRALTVTGPDTIAEGAADVESGAYTVTRTGTDFSGPTSVTWTVSPDSDGGANPTEAADFVEASRSGTLNFNPGDTSLTFTLTVAGDALNEGDEAFTVQLSGAGSDTDYGMAASTTITDSADDAIAVTLGPDAASTTDERISVVAALSGGIRTADVIVPLNLGAGDQARPLGILTIAASDSATASDTGTFTAVLAGNDENEADRTVTVTGVTRTQLNNVDLSGVDLSVVDTDLAKAERIVTTITDVVGLRTAGAIAYASGGDQTMVTITDDDPITVSIAANTATVLEGDDAVFDIALEGGTPTAAVVVSYTVSGTGIAADDIGLSSLTGNMFTIATTDAAPYQLVIATVADGAADDGEALTVTLDSATSAGQANISGTAAMAEITIYEAQTPT
ncbi:MAG: hypothetical protein OXU61_11105, partial [Gammaproteobacteria bacterium]|nr:hypothetical protein [Gammaproteobacteria bacterium]